MKNEGLLILGLLAVLGACAPKEEAPLVVASETAEAAPEPMEPEPRVAMAILTPREGQTLEGSLILTEIDGGARIEAEVSGLAPGDYGFHIHEVGDCSAPDFTSAGGHFNPTGARHAGPDAPERHAGDLGNITIGEDGVGSLEETSTMLTLDDGPSSALGRGVILHEKADDLTSQPTGAAGGRIACGVIELDSGEMEAAHAGDAAGHEEGSGES